MPDTFKRLKNFLNTKLANAVRGLKKVPTALKKPEVRKSLYQVLFIIIVVLGGILAIAWAIIVIFQFIKTILQDYGIFLIAIAVTGLIIYNWRDQKKEELKKKKEEALKQQEKQYRPIYNYLKNFMFRILYDPHFCELAELVRPLTINNINIRPSMDIDAKNNIVFYYFRADKRTVEPLEKGVDNIVNLLQSVITNKVETLGIEGICPPAHDSTLSVIAVHEVLDCGSYIRIALVFDNEAYRDAVQSQQAIIRPLLPEDRYIR